MSARFIIGNSLAVLRAMPDASVDLVLSSPPFLALRSYLPPDHPDKGKEIGSEATPGEFIDVLLDITEECRRVLAPHGSLVFELGDTYSGSGGAGGDYDEGGMREGQPKFRQQAANQSWRLREDGSVKTHTARRLAEPKNQPQVLPVNGGPGWPLDKSLCLIPESYRWALVYGRNPFTGRPTPRWRARNVVRWVRPNPPVGALGDKFRPATSELVVACTSRTRYFDLDAVRTPSEDTRARNTNGPKSLEGYDPDHQRRHYETRTTNPVGAPPLDWWSIAPSGYPGAHYAVYPSELCVRPIKAMCPERVCLTCGEPSRRIVSIDHEPNRNTNGPQSIERKHIEGGSPGYAVRADRVAETTGWTDCGHNAWRTGVVLDPFAGSGTTLAVATGHGRDAIGIDLDERNAELARARVGMFLEVEHFDAEVPA